MMLPRVVLAIDTAAFALFGLAFVFLPNAVAHIVTGTAFASPSATADARAIYGGMALGVACCFLLAARGNPEAQRTGLIGSVATFGFIATARLLGIIVDGTGSNVMYALLASEVLGLLLSAWAMRLLASAVGVNR